MAILAFKLSSGEEIIARSTQISNGNYIITYPRAVRVMKDPVSGEVGIGLVPWVISGSDGEDITLLGQSITVIITPARDMLDTYAQETSPLEVPKKQSIILG
jgi:hypothetical protein